MEWILIINLVTADGPTDFMHAFDTEQECEIAAANTHVLQGSRPNLILLTTECRYGQIIEPPAAKPPVST